MDGLERPDFFAGRCFQNNDRVGVAVVARTKAARRILRGPLIQSPTHEAKYGQVGGPFLSNNQRCLAVISNLPALAGELSVFVAPPGRCGEFARKNRGQSENPEWHAFGLTTLASIKRAQLARRGLRIRTLAEKFARAPACRTQEKFAATHRSLWLGSRPRPATGYFF